MQESCSVQSFLIATLVGTKVDLNDFNFAGNSPKLPSRPSNKPQNPHQQWKDYLEDDLIQRMTLHFPSLNFPAHSAVG
jgi:hypothetical protein